MTTVEAARGVTGGVDTHRDIHVAATLDPLDGLLGSESFPTGSTGTAALARDLRGGHQDRRGGHRLLWVRPDALSAPVGVTVVEVDRPNRQERRRSDKSDPLDAVEAARAALSGRATGSPKSRDGAVEAIR